MINLYNTPKSQTCAREKAELIDLSSDDENVKKKDVNLEKSNTNMSKINNCSNYLIKNKSISCTRIGELIIYFKVHIF